MGYFLGGGGWGFLRLGTPNLAPKTQFSSHFQFCFLSLVSGPSGKSASFNSYIHKNICCISGLCSGCFCYDKFVFFSRLSMSQKRDIVRDADHRIKLGTQITTSM